MCDWDEVEYEEYLRWLEVAVVRGSTPHAPAVRKERATETGRSVLPVAVEA